MSNVFSNLYIYKVIFMLELIIAMAISTCHLRRRKWYAGRVLLCATVLLLTAYLFPIPWYNSIYTSFMFLILFVFTICAAYFCFGEPLINILFCGAVAYTSQHIAYQTYNFLLTIAGISNYGDMYSESTSPSVNLFAVIAYVTSYCLIYWIIWIVLSYELPGDDNLNIGGKNVKLLLSFIILLVDVVLNAMFVYGVRYVRLPMIAYIVVYLQSVLCCILTLAILFTMLGREQQKREVVRVNQLWALDRAMYERFKESVDLINIRCHDLKHQISTLRQREENVSMNTLEEIEQAIEIYNCKIKTGNQVLDTILAERYLQCEYEHIRLVCMVQGSELNFISPNDLYSLFGNALSNAIEAAKKVDDVDKKLIHLNVYRRNDMVFIHVDNYCADADTLKITSNGFLETTKQDKENHGYGLRSMHMMAEKLGGGMEYHLEQEMFHLNFFFPSRSNNSTVQIVNG